MTINGHLNELKIPLFALGAKDDVILTNEAVPNQEARECNQPVMVATTAEGAHCCHLTTGSSVLRPASWYQLPCAEFFRFMENHLNGKKVKVQ